MSKRYYPLFFDLEGKGVLVVGGGEVARRKVETLLDYNARISIVSRDLDGTIKGWVDEGKVRYLGSEFRDEFLRDMWVVIAATNDKGLNHRVSESARKKGLLVNAVDQPEDCNFIVPSIIHRGDLVIAVSTSGKSPALAKKIRRELEDRFGEEYALFLIFMGRLRKEILARGHSQKENQVLFQEVVDSPLLDALAASDRKRIHTILREILPGDLPLAPLLEDPAKS
jgi:precorrin-2 dehydrogenase / sirohydrochlorin ferrochelatase